MKKPLPVVELKIDKLVHGGQGLGNLNDGRKCFVWGALPNEIVKAKIIKKRRDYAEGIAVEVIKKNKLRIEPTEPDIYLATSPWQILDYKQESIIKQDILLETFEREGLKLNWKEFYQPKEPHNYRNKMEYSFWYDNETESVSLALYKRGSHLKSPVAGSVLASDAINIVGNELINYINKNKIPARVLKSVIIRSDNNGKSGISLFVKEPQVAKEFINFELPGVIFEVIYSNPKSPASVVTEVLISSDDILSEDLLGNKFYYSVRSFFQINIPIYKEVLNIIKNKINKCNSERILDFYSGVGSIGLSVTPDNKKLILIETSEESVNQAKLNVVNRKKTKLVLANAEEAIDYIESKDLVILDPPRAGLHKKVTNRLINTMPPCIVYLSCNPSTQARDIKLLIDAGYEVEYARGFNFFPRTPHIESLVILNKIQ